MHASHRPHPRALSSTLPQVLRCYGPRLALPPELALTTSMCSQYMSDPGPEHRDYLVRVLDYVHTNRGAVRLFTRSPGKLRTYFG
jgi:hypothetical protein